MKILAIRGCNLASIEGEFEIDFRLEPLGNAGLFAISGHTGAGKSTILDAMCLALYASTPRSEQNLGSYTIEKNGDVKQNDSRLILRRGTGRGWAEVDFIGINGNIYRSRWSVNRAYGKPDGKLQAEEMEVINLSGNIKLNGSKTDLLKLVEGFIGLSFEQFRLSVLLAQNEFSAFLKAPEKQKSDILEKITGSNVYTQISKKIYEKWNDAKIRHDRINDQLNGIELLTAEQIEEVNGVIEKLSAGIKELETQGELVKNKIAWWDKLQSLQNSVNEAVDTHRNAFIVNEAASADRDKLEKRRRANEIAPKYHQWKNSEKELSVLVDSRTKNSEYRDKAKSTFVQTNDELMAAKQSVTEAQAKHAELKPVINEARRLDSELKVALQNKGSEKENLDNNLNEIKNLSATIENLNNQSKGIKDEQQKLNDWFLQHQAYQSVVPQSGRIVELLKNFHETSGDIENLQQRIKQNTQNKEQEDRKLSSCNENIKKIKEQGDRIRKETEALKSAIEAVNIDSVRIQLKDNREYLQLLVESLVAFGNWSNSSVGLAEKAKELEKQKAQHADLVNDKKETEIQLTAALQAFKEAEREFEIFKYAAEELITNIRAELKDNDPCPVCGSREHHFEAVGNNVVEAHRKKLNDARSKYETLNQKSTSLAAHEEMLNKSIKKSEEEYKAADEKHQKVLADWKLKETLLKVKTTGVIFENESVFQNEKQRVDSLIADLEAKERQYDALNKKLQDSLVAIDENSNELEKVNVTTQDIEKKVNSLQISINSDSEQLTAKKQKESQLGSECDNLIGLKQWKEEWQNDNISFIKKIESVSSQWINNQTANNELIQKLEGIKGQLTSNEASREIKSRETENLNSRYNDALSKFEALTGDRSKLLEGRSAEVVEKEIAELLDGCNVKYNEAQERFSSSKSELEKSETTLENLQQQIDDKENSIKTLLADIESWCTKQQSLISLVELEQLLSLDAEWELREKERLDALATEAERLNAVLKEREQQLNLHKNLPAAPDTDEESKEKLNELLTTIIAEKDQKGNEKVEKSSLLTNDKNNKTKFHEVKQVLENHKVVRDNWAQLNDILGAADGKKFRTIVQGYTLDYLLISANEHLRELSARYRLERIEDTLGIQVIDQYMCDESRSVISLSGGESFLVSLALALGLSSLTSDRVNVESLFIDEGFGSLDMDTLRIAMEALTNLQTRGRKIGVISHVQEMTEAIGVRINVEKQGLGSSRVRISAS